MASEAEYELVLTDAPEASAREAILRPLVAFNEAQIGPSDGRPLALLLREPAGGAVTGGLWGRTSWGWLFIELLAVPEHLRHQRLGSELMRQAEAEAARRGCIGVRLDTFSFQALGFYQKLGYAVFGQLDDHPPGHSRYFLSKRLPAAG
ncbi:GNAT family N-acetyltransferase [Roseomonas sp. BN140053]|uniref:GNAT family N-acetyltransferase n=1 Tax=Roseomonas sp. BN140053 TaxID=3391898 RepID=UPI0039E85A3D